MSWSRRHGKQFRARVLHGRFLPIGGRLARGVFPPHVVVLTHVVLLTTYGGSLLWWGTPATRLLPGAHAAPPQENQSTRDEHWAFTAPSRPEIPSVRGTGWSRSSIDRFVLTRLEREGLAPSSPASRETLLRRVTLDLTGLPPTPAEVTEFLDDSSPDAYERVVDRLLHSPRYGEQLAASWLDAARYADTDGYQNDRYRYMHYWRDWVILSLNENKGFDSFVTEQLAGDLLPKATLRQQIATGFCRNHRINSENGSIPAEWHVENVADRVDTLGTVFLGLTVSCARCHDHKYDPVSQEEYYRLFAYFNNVPEWGVGPNNGNSPPYVTVPASWPHLTAQEDQAIEPVPLKLTEPKKGQGLKRPIPGDATTAMILHELEKPRATHLLNRGRYDDPDLSRPLPPGVPASLQRGGEEMPRDRLELARWLVDGRHPLTARVAVNRYWQQLFGSGLVRTSDNFGTQGEPPSHPHLLDWLATEFVHRNWDVKALLRDLVTSSTYRQASRVTPEILRQDPENRLLARAPRFRVSAFTLRDQALFASGLLVEKIGGPSAKPYMPPKIWASISNNVYKQDHGANLYRRSLYTYWRRTIAPPTMLTLDAAEREVCIIRKERTNTPLQALTLMNNRTFVEAARLLAERILREGGGDLTSRLSYGFQLTTGRLPRPPELDLLRKAHDAFLERYRNAPAAAEELLATGEAPRDTSQSAAEQAAMTLLASTILNLDETVTKE